MYLRRATLPIERTEVRRFAPGPPLIGTALCGKEEFVRMPNTRGSQVLALCLALLLSPLAAHTTRGPSTPEERERALDPYQLGARST